MNILFCGDIAEPDYRAWMPALQAALPEARWLDLAAARAAPETVTAAVVANPAPGSLVGLPKLGLIQSLWAGVDRLMSDATLPPGVPVARMVDPAMAAAMAETALWATLALHRGFFTYAQRQREGRWRVHAQRRADELRVAVLGCGRLGTEAARRIAQQGYRTRGWRAHAATGGAEVPPGVEVHVGEAALWPLLAQTDIVVNLLPLTPATRGLIDARFLAALPAQASLVNLARGGHVVDADLLAALDAGRLRHAVLDVFHTEPLPPGHRYWTHPQVTMLPHAAALTDPRSAALVAAANLRALRDGRPLAHLVDRARGY